MTPMRSRSGRVTCFTCVECGRVSLSEPRLVVQSLEGSGGVGEKVREQCGSSGRR
jgi:hypothetical protein